MEQVATLLPHAMLWPNEKRRGQGPLLQDGYSIPSFFSL